MLLKTNTGNNTVKHALGRDILSLSCINAIETSAIDIVEVIAAITRNEKNNTDQI